MPLVLYDAMALTLYPLPSKSILKTSSYRPNKPFSHPRHYHLQFLCSSEHVETTYQIPHHSFQASHLRTFKESPRHLLTHLYSPQEHRDHED
ncbi:hypothetical protein ACSBR1_040516 [Camellia fascicularis]